MTTPGGEGEKEMGSISREETARQYRAVFDAEVRFSNEGGLQAQGFRVDLPHQDVSHEEIGRLFVTSLDLLMTQSVTLHDVRIIEEPHKGTRGGPSDPRDAGQGEGHESR